VQNLLVLRFANMLIEPIWSRASIDHVQITVAEQIGVEGRGEYYDKSGALRDMVQNHMLQLLCLVALESPNSMDADAIRTEKLKVLSALRRIDASNVGAKTVRGQYKAGLIDGKPVASYADDLGKPSKTETFVSIKAEVDNWRWAGVPFYLRTGKRLTGKRTEIVVYFKQLPHNIFKDSFRELPPNKLIIHLQPNEGVEIEMLNKIPGIDEHIKLKKTKLDLSFSDAFKKSRIFGGYEKLVLEAMRGNPTLFLSREEIEQAWTWIDSIQNAWQHYKDTPKPYSAGTWGPVASVALIARDGRAWEE
jgi:glucose-6-phosphate 1-dehydrogenase